MEGIILRRFAVAKGWEDKNISLPQRSTEFSAGYDIEAAEDVIVPSIWKMFLHRNEYTSNPKPTMVHTGVKVYMNKNEVLEIFPRSSNAVKRFLSMPNSVAIIDKDYADNLKNDGEIGVPLWNFGFSDMKIKKGERIAQGLFKQFLTTDDDAKHKKTVRTGGFGSTGVDDLVGGLA